MYRRYHRALRPFADQYHVCLLSTVGCRGEEAYPFAIDSTLVCINVCTCMCKREENNVRSFLVAS